MTWTPPWLASRALGALDSNTLAREWIDAFVAGLKRSKVFPQYQRVARQIGDERASKAVVPQLNPIAHAVTGARGLPFIIDLRPAGFGSVGAQAFAPQADGEPVVIVAGVPPLPSTSAKAFYEAFDSYLMAQLPHELQHVPQLLAKVSRGLPAGPAYEQMDRRTRAYKRRYIGDSHEVVAYSVNIANELRAAGVKSIGFPASPAAIAASPSLKMVYRALDPRVPADAKVLKSYTTKIARFL